MNDHLKDGQLRAALDGEINPEEQGHIRGCKSCQTRLEAIRAQADRSSRKLAFLSAESEQPVPNAAQALARFQKEKTTQKEYPMFQRLFSHRVMRFGTAAVAILVLVLAVPATRAMAAQLLGLFRVQQVTVIPVDFSGMQTLAGDNTLGKQIGQMLSSAVTVTRKASPPETVADAAQASSQAAFNVRLPQNLTPSQIVVDQGLAFSFKVDRARAQALIDEAGRKDLVLPDSIDGAEVSVNVPAGVSASYGTCPALTNAESSASIGMNGSTGRRYPDCVIMAEIPSPTVTAPVGVDVSQLAQIGLEFTGMSADQAAAFAKTVNWTSSLVIPIPRNAATYENVPVDGVTGTLIQRPVDDAPQYALIWVKNGIIYAIAGLGSDSQKALNMAASLP